MPSGRYKLVKGDFFEQSKHADVTLTNDDGAWAIYFFDKPVKGKCLTVSYAPYNYPAVLTSVCANWKARAEIAYSKRKGGFKETSTF